MKKCVVEHMMDARRKWNMLFSESERVFLDRRDASLLTMSRFDIVEFSNRLDSQLVKGDISLAYAAMCESLVCGVWLDRNYAPSWNAVIDAYPREVVSDLHKTRCRINGIQKWTIVKRRLFGTHMSIFKKALTRSGRRDITRALPGSRVCADLDNLLYGYLRCADTPGGYADMRFLPIDLDDSRRGFNGAVRIGKSAEEAVVLLCSVVLDANPALMNMRNRKDLGSVLPSSQKLLHARKHEIYGLWCWWKECTNKTQPGKLCNAHDAVMVALVMKASGMCSDSAGIVSDYISYTERSFQND